jgi:putative transposase
VARAKQNKPKKQKPKFKTEDGWTLQPFHYTLDLTPQQWAIVCRHFGGRRFAYNWTVRQLQQAIYQYHAGAQPPETRKPTFYSMRKQFNRDKHTVCVDRETGQVWWPAISKEAFADGVRGAMQAYDNWTGSRAGARGGKRMGFPGPNVRGGTKTGTRSPPGPWGWNPTIAT